MKSTRQLTPIGWNAAATIEDHPTLIDKIPLGLYRRDLQGDLVMANYMFSAMLGYEGPQSLLALNFIRDVCTAPERMRDDRTKTFDPESTWQAEVQLRRRDGTQIA